MNKTFQYAFKKGDRVHKKSDKTKTGTIIGRNEAIVLGIHFPEIYSVKWDSGSDEMNIHPVKLEKKHASK